MKTGNCEKLGLKNFWLLDHLFVEDFKKDHRQLAEDSLLLSVRLQNLISQELLLRS